MTFHIACINCKAPTQQAEMRGGRCPSCGDKHDQTVPVKLQFEAVLTAMPLDQKRVLLKSNAFQRA
jgi:Zn finger protein HypA/HybF involved in hydrogenase expression